VLALTRARSEGVPARIEIDGSGVELLVYNSTGRYARLAALIAARAAQAAAAADVGSRASAAAAAAAAAHAVPLPEAEPEAEAGEGATEIPLLFRIAPVLTLRLDRAAVMVGNPGLQSMLVVSCLAVTGAIAAEDVRGPSLGGGWRAG
jgi:hypothetical protein